ncbi:hypothetical protein RHMOL_Rhmol12G0146400 [Rhododendron molle]|uniref:Uncharacterized protein n=1 Tax=Rhododendron molle TaxID=49168 RepID=A0ACC0LJP8_RHOML|nr:hypothetical protein RHMOL_Rhmol12G0146400 [Rhododendron molle]
MGLLPCPLAFHSNEDSDTPQSRSTTHLHSDSSLSSQPSLPSVPSLTSQKSQPHDPSLPLSTTRHLLISTLKGHSSAVFFLALAGKHIYSGSSDSEIRSWSRDPSTPNPDSKTVIPSSHGAVKSIVVSGDTLFTAHQDHKIRVWKIDNPTKYYPCVNTLPTVRDRFARFFCAKDYVEVRRHKKRTWVHHVDAVSALALSRDGSLLYSASWDRTFKVWRTSDFKCLESAWNAHDDAINAVAVSSVDGSVYTGSADTRIKVWKRHEGEKRHRLVDTLEKHKSAVNALALSTDGSVLYSGACDRSIVVWEKDGCGGGEGGGGDGRHMVVAGALRGHKKAILCLVVVAADLVCSGSADKTVRIWRRGRERDYSCLAVLEGHRGPVKCLAAAVDTCSGDSHSTSYNIYSGSLDFDIKVWQVRVPFV